MSSAPLRKCSLPTCAALAIRSGRCQEHATANERLRGSSSERGYDQEWRRFRARLLRMPCRRCDGNPVATCPLCGGSGLRFAFCKDCLLKAKMVLSAEIHHLRKLRDGGARLDPDNCVGLCKPHHQKRTAAGE